jgi:hypothetical protein
MHSRRFACLLIGLWLGGGFLMAWIAIDNRTLSSRVTSFADPAAMLRIRALGPSQTTALLRHEAAELTRGQLETWELAQIALGGFLFSFLLFGTGEGKLSLGLALCMLLCVLVQRFLLSPQTESLGRLTDFMSVEAAAGYRARLLVMQGAYTGVELTKWIMGGALSLILISRRRAHSGNSWQQFNVVDKANHRHVDR